MTPTNTPVLNSVNGRDTELGAGMGGHVDETGLGSQLVIIMMVVVGIIP